MIKRLADENFPSASIDVLTLSGFDTRSVLKQNPGISDKEIVVLANQENRLILTFDRDFGHLIFKEGVLLKMAYFISGYKNLKPLLQLIL